MEQKRKAIAADAINNIFMDVDCANIVVRMEDVAEVIVEAEVEPDAEYISEVSGDKLCVRYQWRKSERHIIKNTDTAHMVVTLPRGKKLNEFEVKLGAGSASLQETELCCGRIRMETGAGKIKVGKMTADERVDVEIGAGAVELASVQTQALNVACGVGQFGMHGRVPEGLTVDCGVGHCDIDLEGKETDYNYDISCGIGKVSVNGNRMSGIGSAHTKENPDAKGNVKVSCGLGKVIIKIS